MRLPRSIYTPAGAAYEYAPLACNLWATCSHSCDYCYCPQVLHVTREEFHKSGPCKPGILESLRRAAIKRDRNNDRKRVLFGFVGDCYCPEEARSEVTRIALQIMGDWHIPCGVLTKGGTRACRDFDVLAEADGHFGTSLIWGSDWPRQWCEPGAAPVANRIEALAEAHRLGISTWMSVEPVKDPAEALAAIRMTLPYVDEYRLGKDRRDAAGPDDYWPSFLREAIAMMRDAGKRWYIKDSLRPFLRGLPATGTEVQP